MRPRRSKQLETYLAKDYDMKTDEIGSKRYFSHIDMNFTADITFDVVNHLGRPATQGFIKNDGSNRIDIQFRLVEYKTFGQKIRLYAGEHFKLEGLNIIAIKLNHVANTKYRFMVN